MGILSCSVLSVEVLMLRGAADKSLTQLNGPISSTAILMAATYLYLLKTHTGLPK